MSRNFSFPVYQIDFSAVAAGKRVAATKRRVRWYVCLHYIGIVCPASTNESLFVRRFGFPNEAALADGLTGTDCRGEEHEVVIVWSVTSGKRQILMDGREVHYSSNRVGIIDFSWNTKGNHVLKTLCHAAAPMTPTPGFRQYDLLIDGQSFFTMPKVYELGIKGSSANENRVPGVNYREAGSYTAGATAPIRVPRTSSEEDAELQRAIQASLEESKTHLNKPEEAPSRSAITTTSDLLGFEGTDPMSSPPALQPDPSMNSFTSAPQPVSTDYALGAPPPQYTPQSALYPPPSPAYSAPPPSYQPEPSYGAPQTNVLALPGPAPAQASYGGAPQPAYGAPPPAQAAYGAPSPAQPAYGAPQPAYGAPAPPPPQPQQFPAQPAYSQGSDPLGVHGGTSAYEDPFAPKPPTHTDVASDILKAYGGGTPTSAASGRYQPGQPFPTTPTANGGTPYTEQNGGTPASLSMNGLALTDGEEEPKNPFEAAMKKLVNVDHIDQPADEQLKLSLQKERDAMAKKNKSKSVPLPPAGARKVGSGATLQEISQVKGPTKMETVMKPPPGLFQGDAAAAGALVIHGQGPPPLQPQGFGVVHMQGQYPQQAYGHPQGYGYR